MFFAEVRRNTTVGCDYKVDIRTTDFDRDLQDEYLTMLQADAGWDEGDAGSLRVAEVQPPETSAAPCVDQGVGGSGGGDDGVGGGVPPRLTICILIVGTRGDVQPFIAIGQRLKVRDGGGGRGLGKRGERGSKELTQCWLRGHACNMAQIRSCVQSPKPKFTLGR